MNAEIKTMRIEISPLRRNTPVKTLMVDAFPPLETAPISKITRKAMSQPAKIPTTAPPNNPTMCANTPIIISLFSFD
ncbi:hypothetical protein KKF70_00405 [bacterium]|nr:hypothetical protein [bacterium]